MKGVFYISTLYGGGAERVLVNLMNFLVDRGEKVELVLNQRSGPYLSLLDQSIKIHELDADQIKHSIFELAEYLNRSNPDFAMSTLDDCNYALALAGKFSKVKPRILVRQSSSFLTKTKYLTTFRKFYERLKARLFYPLADIVIVNSKGARSELAKLIGGKGKKIKVLPNPLDMEYIQDKAKEEIPNNIANFLNGKPYILSAGRLIQAKGYNVLIEAFARLKDKECRLIILGEGSKRTELEDLIIDIGIDNRVLLPGYVDNPYAIMDKADLFVLSSRREGMPNVLIEAMALELPLVSTDCPSGPRELLQNGRFGQLVPVDNVEKLSIAMDNQLGSNIYNIQQRNKYVSQFDIKQVGNLFLSYLILDE